MVRRHGCGIFAVILSSLLVGYFFIPPLYSMSIAKESRSFFTAFILCAIAITVVSSARKRAESAVRTARDELEVRVKERTAELEQSNRETQESERQLRQLTEAIPQQIWRADASGNVEYCNGHLLAYLGRPTALLQGESFFNIFHAVDEPMVRQAWRAALESKNSFEAEARVRNASGSYRWFLVRAVPQLAGDGAVARWYGIHIDIEEQRRAQQSLAEAQEEQSRISHLLSMAEMAASIAHELNQPLTAVVTHAYACREWLREDGLNIAKASATAEKIVQESTRASAVVSRVRALFRKEAQTRESTDMNGLIRGAVRLLRDEAIRRDVSIRLMLADQLPKLNVDPVQIQQVLLNLAMNAMDAMAGISGQRELTIRSLQKAKTKHGYRSKIMGRALRKISQSASSNHSSRPNLTELAWGWQFAVALSKCTTGGSGQRTVLTAEQFFTLQFGHRHERNCQRGIGSQADCLHRR